MDIKAEDAGAPGAMGECLCPGRGSGGAQLSSIMRRCVMWLLFLFLREQRKLWERAHKCGSTGALSHPRWTGLTPVLAFPELLELW